MTNRPNHLVILYADSLGSSTYFHKSCHSDIKTDPKISGEHLMSSPAGSQTRPPQAPQARKSVRTWNWIMQIMLKFIDQSWTSISLLLAEALEALPISYKVWRSFKHVRSRHWMQTRSNTILVPSACWEQPLATLFQNFAKSVRCFLSTAFSFSIACFTALLAIQTVSKMSSFQDLTGLCSTVWPSEANDEEKGEE